MEKDGTFSLLTGTKFAYDQRGRLMADTSFFDNQKTAMTTYTYQQDTVWIHRIDYVHSGNWEEQISYHYTDSGYIEKTIRRENQNNMIQTTTVKKEYIFDASNRLIRGGDYHYTYVEDGGYMQYYEVQDYYKEEKYFNNKGYITKEQNYTPDPYTDGWILAFSMTVEYFYNPDNPNPNTPFPSRVQQVYGIEGGMIIKSEVPEYISIYSISGRLVQRTQTTSGNQWIPLAKGIYVVTAGSNSYKVMVK